MENYFKRYKTSLSRQDWRCTWWFNGNWEPPCCTAHDYACADAYALKSENDRLDGDLELMNCVNKKNPGMGDFMFRWIRRYLKFKLIVFRKPMY